MEEENEQKNGKIVYATEDIKQLLGDEKEALQSMIYKTDHAKTLGKRIISLINTLLDNGELFEDKYYIVQEVQQLASELYFKGTLDKEKLNHLERIEECVHLVKNQSINGSLVDINRILNTKQALVDSLSEGLGVEMRNDNVPTPSYHDIHKEKPVSSPKSKLQDAVVKFLYRSVKKICSAVFNTEVNEKVDKMTSHEDTVVPPGVVVAGKDAGLKLREAKHIHMLDDVSATLLKGDVSQGQGSETPSMQSKPTFNVSEVFIKTVIYLASIFPARNSKAAFLLSYFMYYDQEVPERPLNQQQEMRPPLRRPLGVHYGNLDMLQDFLAKLSLIQRNNPACHTGVILDKDLILTDSKYTKGVHYDEMPDPIGRGGFGTVYGCRDKRTGKEFVCKSQTFLKFDRREVDVPCQLQGSCEFIMKIYGVVYSQGTVEIFMQKADTDWNKIKRNVCLRLGIDDVIHLFHGALVGLVSFHRLDIWHMDIKPENLGVLNNNTVILDLGSCQTLHHQTKHSGTTPIYEAPELLHREYSDRCDVYSLACAMIFMITGRRVFFDKVGYDRQQKAQETKQNPNLVKQYLAPIQHDFPTLHNLLDLMLDQDLSVRPTARQSLGHQLFVDFGLEKGATVPNLQPSSPVGNMPDLAALGGEESMDISPELMEIDGDANTGGSSSTSGYESLNRKKNVDITLVWEGQLSRPLMIPYGSNLKDNKQTLDTLIYQVFGTQGAYILEDDKGLFPFTKGIKSNRIFHVKMTQK